MGDREAKDAAKAKAEEMKNAYRNLPLAQRLAAGRVKAEVLKNESRPHGAMDCTPYPNASDELRALERRNAELLDDLDLA